MMKCKLQKTYNSSKRTFHITIDTEFHLQAINVLYGPSGAGKTSLLRLISGLEKVDKGTIKVKQSYWLQTQIFKKLPLRKRNIAFVFQDYGLFPNMTVLDNLKFAQKKNNIELFNDVINTFEIKHLLKSKPDALSGGQKQRVALARALVQKPDFLFLDEPLSAIDEVLRNKLQLYLKTLQRKYLFTVLMVSHSLQEVLKLADYVYLMNYGEIIEKGTPDILLAKNPQNLLKATVLNIGEHKIQVWVGLQQISIEKQRIIEPKFNIGDLVTITL